MITIKYEGIECYCSQSSADAIATLIECGVNEIDKDITWSMLPGYAEFERKYYIAVLADFVYPENWDNGED